MRILATTDGAAYSDLAVQTAAFLSRESGGELVILTVAKHESDRPAAGRILERSAALLPEEMDRPQLRLRVGQMPDEIITEAIDGSFDLIVVGEGPHDSLSSRLLGPRVMRIISHKPCPILIARTFSRPIKKLLLCEGGREPSLLSRLINSIPGLLKISDDLTILHVMSQITAAPGIPDWELDTDAQTLMALHTPEGQLLTHDLELLTRLNVQLQAKVRYGMVVQEILAEAAGDDYDLIVIGAHQTRGWQRFLLDDLAHEIVDKGTRPLLVI